MKVCRHCGEPILPFTFKEGEQWWHTTAITAGPDWSPPRAALPVPAPTYRRCYADPAQPYAEPAQ
jgi:hypothetical protein